MNRDEQPIDVTVCEPFRPGPVHQLLAGLGIEARAVEDLARHAPAGRVIVCLDNPLTTVRVRAEGQAMAAEDALNEWESRYHELRARTPRRLRLVVHSDSLRHDPQAEAGRLAAWLGARVSTQLLATAAAEVVGSLGAQLSTAEDLLASGASDSLIGLYVDLCAEAGPVYHRALADEAGPERVGVLGPTQRDGQRSEPGAAELMARLQAELTDAVRT
jgi:hypothetical protein